MFLVGSKLCVGMFEYGLFQSYVELIEGNVHFGPFFQLYEVI